MPLRTTAGQLAINQALPPDMRDYSRVLDSKTQQELFQQLATKHPDAYRKTLKQLGDVGREASYYSGGFSPTLGSLRTSQALRNIKGELEAKVEEILDRTDLDEEQKNDQIIQLTHGYVKPLEKAVLEESLAERNPLALQILSGARGNPANLKSLRGADLLYVDHRDRTVPFPILRNYSQGLSPAEFFAAAFGARKGVVDVKLCCAGDTEVLMADFSVKQIQDVRVGEWVFAAGRDGKLRPSQVSNVFENGQRECWRYTFRVSSCKDRVVQFTSTEDHKILAQVREGRPGSTYAHRSIYDSTLLPLSQARLQTDPVKNTFVAIPAAGCAEDLAVKDEPLALLYGLLLGDGCCTSSSWSLSCGDPVLVEDVREYLDSLNLRLGKPKNGYTWPLGSKIWWPKEVRDGKCYSGNPHRKRLRDLGVAKHAHLKTLTPEVWTWTQEAALAAVAGLFSSDACIELGKNGHISIRLFMTAEHVVKDVKRLLELRFGIWGGKTQYIPLRKKSHMRNPQWGFVITHPVCVQRFAEIVPLVGVKGKILREAVAARPPLPPRSREIGFKVLGREYVGAIPTYDLEVRHSEHMFALANGLIVSNSVADAGFFCLARRTRVRMAHGVKEIQDIVPGDLVLAVDTNFGGEPSVVAVKVRAVFANGKKRVHRTVFCDRHGLQYELFSTREHRVLTPNGVQAVGDEQGPSQVWHANQVDTYADGVAASFQLVTRRDQEDYGMLETWDIEVDHPDHLFLLENGLVVENSKQLKQAAHRLVVTQRDTDDPLYARRGMPVDVDDPDNEGSFLSFPVGGYERNTLLTPKVLADLKDKGIERMVVRSPIVGGPPEGGVYSMDIGMRDRPGPSPIGDQAGQAAAQALGEKVSQGGLCLMVGTLVRMADNSSRPIEDVQPGELVVGVDHSGWPEPVRVVDRYYSGMREIYEYRFQPGAADDGTPTPDPVTLYCSSDHKVLVLGATQLVERAMGELPIGTVVPLIEHDARRGELVDATLISASRAGMYHCYDLEVDSESQLFLLANRLAVHNSSKHCLAKGTEVLRSDGCSAKIQDLVPGDHVLAWDLAAGKAVQATIVRCYANGRRPCHAVFVPQPEAASLYASERWRDWSAPYSNYLVADMTVEHKLLMLKDGQHVVLPLASHLTGEADLVVLAPALRRHGGKLADCAGETLLIEPDAYHQEELKKYEPDPADWEETYDIEIDHPDHLFILECGLVVSNSGGVVGSQANRSVSGFKLLNQLIQIPKTYTGGSIHAQQDGIVRGIEPAPAGGMFVTVNGERHFVPQGLDPTVWVGDEVEAGDALSEGIPNPAEITKHKGIGEGRRYFTQLFKKAMNDSGMEAARRNVELLARGVINHVRLQDEHGPYLPDDVVPYDVLESDWEPREGYISAPPKDVIGKYLERPALQYTIGTRITPKVVRQLEEFGVDYVDAHDEQPPFVPEMVRGLEALQKDPDWIARQLGSGLEKGLRHGVRDGAVSDAGGTSHVPALVNPHALLNFGQQGLTRTWDPKKKPETQTGL